MDNNRRLDPDKTTISIGVPTPNGPDRVIDIPLNQAFAVFSAIHAIGYNNVVSVIHFVTDTSKEILGMGWSGEPATHAFVSVLGLFEDRRSQPTFNEKSEHEPKEKKQQEELTLSFCYTLLRKKVISRAKAAEIATALLNLDKPINADAWRSKVDRWAERQELQPVEIRKRGKKSKAT